MRYAGWTRSKQREPVTASGIKRGCRIIVAITSDNLDSVDAFANSDPLDLSDGNTEFRRAYVDKIDENAGILHFTACKEWKPHERTTTRGVAQLHEEGKTWAGGWTDDVLAALRATYNLSGDDL